jgi:hypothetical protein
MSEIGGATLFAGMATFTSPDRPAFPELGDARSAGLNRVPPPPPVVIRVIPLVGVADGASRARLGLRVQVGGPWGTTGHGELLGVILDRPSDPAPTATLVGPDLAGGRSAGPVARHFPRAVAVLPDIDGRHTVVGHEVTLDLATGCWSAEIELAAVFGYRPSLRLTLACYQPDSVPGAALSSFVTIDPIRL